MTQIKYSDDFKIAAEARKLREPPQIGTPWKSDGLEKQLKLFLDENRMSLGISSCFTDHVSIGVISRSLSSD